MALQDAATREDLLGTTSERSTMLLSILRSGIAGSAMSCATWPSQTKYMEIRSFRRDTIGLSRTTSAASNTTDDCQELYRKPIGASDISACPISERKVHCDKK